MDISNANATAGAVPVDIHGGSPLGRSAPPRAPAAPPPPGPVPGAAGRRRRAVARGVQSALARTSLLAIFLPTGTLLAFELVLPVASASGRDGGGGSCSAAGAAALRALLALCSASCFLLHFTDSFRAPGDGKVYYGVVTPRGLSLLGTGLGDGVEAPRDDRYRLAFVDVVHAAMSVLVFAAVALADGRVSGCLLPAGHRKEVGEVMERLPLVVGAVCSGLFLVFPNTRYGIGCLAADQSMAV